MLIMINKIYKILVLTIFLSFVAEKGLSSENELSSNINVLDSLCSKAAKEILLRLDQNREDSITISFAPHPASWLLEQYLLNDGKATEKLFLAKPNVNVSTLTINIKKAGVEYITVENTDSLIRKISLIISYKLEKPSGILYGLPQITLVHENQIDRNDVSFLENSPYSFARGNIPEQKRSFLEEITEPAIFISTAIITIILLFSVRSG